MLRPLLLLACLTILALAGCLDPSDATGDGTQVLDDWARQALPFGGDHDHADPAHHMDRSTPNFEVLGYMPWTSGYYGGASGGGYLCGDAQEVEDGRRLAVVESRSDVAFGLADITDPIAPEYLGEMVMEHTYLYDVAMVLDGQHVVLGSAGTDNLPGPVPLAPRQATERLASAEDGAPGTASRPGPADEQAGGTVGRTPTLTWNSPCASESVQVAPTDTLPYPMNLMLVDISDPNEPVMVDNLPLPGYAHSIFPYRLDGRDILLVTTSAPENPYTSWYALYEVDHTGPTSRLVPLSTYHTEDEGTPTPFDGPRGHDAWIEEHPVTGRHTAYLAGGPWLTTLDVSDPSAPEVLSIWEEPVADSFLHGAYPVPGTWNDRHYLVVGPEYCNHPEHTPSGVNWVLDVTDPTDPFVVAGWTLPHEVEYDGCYMFSNHYFTVVNETLFESMYHGGVWAIDLSPIKEDPDAFHNLDAVGVFLPADDTLPEAVEPVRWAPTIEEVLAMPDGTLVTFDGNYGIYTLRFDTEMDLPRPEPWPIEEP